MEWLRWYHGCVTDPKFPLIARRSGQSVASVLAVWAALLERASQADDRGNITGFDCESFDVLFGLDDGACQDILSAFESKGMIIGGKIMKWDERQSKDETSAERKRLQREREKLSRDVTPGHAMSRDVTPGHAMSLREEEIREEKNKNTTTQGTTGNEDPARARSDPPGEFSDFSDIPGIEFQELRQFYDEHCRAEAPLTGFTEYKQLRASRRWPGMSRICDAIDAHARADPAGWKKFCPGLVKFLREHWWEKKPTARASPAQDESPLHENMRTSANVLAERQRRRQANDTTVRP